LTSKFGKIGLLDDPGGQGSRSKDFICRLNLSNGLELRPRKEKSRFGCFWTSQWAFENPIACSPQGFTASRWSKINVPEHFIMVSTLLNHFLLEFWKKKSNKILVKQRKVQLLLERPCHFSEKKNLKNQEYALEF
jgi:hypothetical protein